MFSFHIWIEYMDRRTVAMDSLYHTLPMRSFKVECVFWICTDQIIFSALDKFWKKKMPYKELHHLNSPVLLHWACKERHQSWPRRTALLLRAWHCGPSLQTAHTDKPQSLLGNAVLLALSISDSGSFCFVILWACRISPWRNEATFRKSGPLHWGYVTEAGDERGWGANVTTRGGASQ